MFRQQTRSFKYTSTVLSPRIATDSASALASRDVYGRSSAFPLPGIVAPPFPACPQPAVSSRSPSSGFTDVLPPRSITAMAWRSLRNGGAQSKAFIADVEPERRATAIGVYNFVTGVIYLPASLIAGALWAVHPSIVFIVAAFLSLAAITASVLLRPAGNST